MKIKTTKLALSLATLILSSMAFAQIPDPSIPTGPKIDAFVWIKSQLTNGVTFVDLPGHTPLGKRCALFLTDKSYRDDEDYLIVVGYPDAKHPNDYVGVVASASQAARIDSILTFESKESWGNGSTFNRVRISTDELGKPLHANGVSDVNYIDCRLD